MTVYVMDSSAVLRYIDKEAGADHVIAIFKMCVRSQAEARMSAVQWGEIAGNLRRKVGALNQNRILESLIPLELEIIPASGERAVRAAELRVDRKISYADAFALELAMTSADHVLITADYDFKTVADLARIEFLPLK
jgi:PIN domain nuclease of toxin-antitoxin system